MSAEQTAESPVEVIVSNVGGITETKVEISLGVTILTGRNATNRTSLLRAIMAGLGSDDAALKGDTDEGSVELTIDSETYLRTLARRNGSTIFDGEPYLGDGELADLFAFLLESNDARRAVEQCDDLYDVIMRPVDTEKIDAEIDRLESEREERKAELDELVAIEQQLPELEERRMELESELEDKGAELEEKRVELEEFKGDTAAPSAFENRFEELREARSDLEEVRRDLEDERCVVEALRDDREERKADLDGLAVADDDELDELEAEISQRRNAIQTIESALSELQSVMQFNESLLDGEGPAILESVRARLGGEPEGAVTDKLLDHEKFICWTCSSQVERSQIKQTVDVLREVHTEKIGERSEMREEIAELEAEHKHLKRTKEDRRRLRRQLDEVEAELEERTERIGHLESEGDDLEATIEDLEDAVEELESDDHDELLALHREVNELEFEHDQLEAQLDDALDEIESIEGRIAKRGEVEDQRGAINEEIEALRSRIERLETEAVKQFNDQMDTILDLLEFENLERIWIERVEREVKEGRRKVTMAAFDLHVTRANDSGAVYKDTVDHLSESEREVVGLVFALSGYLVHEVYELVPFMLLDSLEALDSERLSTLVDHLAQFADYLVVALLPEDAAALDDIYQRVTGI